MPRAEPLNEKIIEALTQRYRKCEQLNQRKKFDYEKALVAINKYGKNITTPAHLQRINNIPGRVFNEILQIMDGTLPVEAAPPTPGELQAAQQRGRIEFPNPPGRSTGRWGILLAMLWLRRERKEPVTIPEIKLTSNREIHVNLDDGEGNATKWSGIKRLELNFLVERNALSRHVGGAGTGRFGGRRDEFKLTERGVTLAEHLLAQEPELQQRFPPSRGAAAAPRGAAAGISAAWTTPARSPVAGRDLLDILLQGPEFVDSGGDGIPSGQRYAAAAAAPAAFTGRGRVLGGSCPVSRSRAASMNGLHRHLFNDDLHEHDAFDDEVGLGDEELDEEGFPLYRPEMFEADEPREAQEHRSTDHATAPAAAGRRFGTPSRPRSNAAVGGTARGTTALGFSSTAATAAADAGAAARAAVHGSLLRRVSESKRKLPLCDPGTSCISCAHLREFMQDDHARVLPMMLAKKCHGHLKQTVSWLVSTEGGSFSLALETTSDSKTVTVCKLAAGDGKPIPRAPVHDPLAALQDMLAQPKAAAKQQLLSPPPRAAPVSPAAPPPAAAAGRADSNNPMSPAQRAAAAAEARIALQQQEQAAQRQHEESIGEQQQQQQTAAAAVKQPICLLDPTQQGDDAKIDLLQELQAAEYHSLDPPDKVVSNSNMGKQQQQQHVGQQQHKRKAVLQVIPDSDDDAGGVSVGDGELAGACEHNTATGAARAAAGQGGRSSGAAAAPMCILIDSQDAEPQWADPCVDGLGTAGNSAAAGAASKRRRHAGYSSNEQSPAIASGDDKEYSGVGSQPQHLQCTQQPQLRFAQQDSRQPMCIELLESQAADAADLDMGLKFGCSASLSRQPPIPNGHVRRDGCVGTAGAAAAAAAPSAAAAAAAAPQAAAAAAQASVGAAAAAVHAAGSAFELKLVVDDKERSREDHYNQIYNSIRREHLRMLVPQLERGMTVDIDRDLLPIGDYLWLVLPSGSSIVTAAAVDSQDADAEERAAAEERSGCVLAGAVVERKTMKDLVGRSSHGDHLRQMQRMYHLHDLLPVQLLLVENTTKMAAHYTAYQSDGPRHTSSACTVVDEPSLFDFLVRAAVSPYGSAQRILLAPSPADTRDVLLAVSQLMLHEQQLLQQQLQHSSQGQQQQQPFLAASQTTYSQLKQLCSQVKLRLPRTEIPGELLSQETVPNVATDVAFTITRSAAKSEYADLQLYSHNTYPQLQIVSLEGQRD